MRSKLLLVPFLFFAVMLVLCSCGMGPADGTSDMAGVPTNGVAPSTEKTDAVIGGTDRTDMPELTTAPGEATDVPTTDVTSDVVTESDRVTEPPLTTAPATTPAVRPPEGK